ncbi:MAG TPA: hypothetical protein VK808_11670 [Bacteroidia bacterium]|jgi:hypothetical protein|nr:hypothetical protein [Bacteroidia bacterium]
MQFTFVIFLVTLILFRRVKRSIGFQKYSQPTLIIRVVLFSIITLAILAFAILNPKVLLPDGLGILAGLVLAYIATNHAQFEKREDGLYYKTHLWVEITVICLFLARFIYRVVILKDMFQPDQSQQEIHERMQSIQDPITGSILFAFCTYYIGYFSFILKEAKKEIKE